MTKSELIALLREAQTALEGALYGETGNAPRILDHIAAALRSETALGTDGACAVCGEAVTQPATGRPRMYCCGACKKRAQRARQRG
ncbi:hypothetical protein SAMN05428944_3890 [Streptomyces sp. 1222.5]|nr:hypothetical protein BX260_4204 [Streptomyces sp. 5112.2]SEC48274.1 hypothetical protein SAMN05428944_3890 [Streptomyces sp. 1222.5]SED40731.1 hypothetical protein SAMN05216532_4458 [Streptomyces sp. 2231.1]